MSKEELEGLSPEEKIKKLKELEKKKRKEIDEARELLKESEEELSSKEEMKRKVPIPEIAKEDVSDASEAEKEILKAHKGLEEKKSWGESEEVSEETEEKKNEEFGGGSETTPEESLEEIAFREKENLPRNLVESEYAAKLSQEPMQNIYREIKDINQTVEEKGYVSAEEGRKIEYLNAATERKLEDIEAGRYSLTEAVAEEALLTKKISSTLRKMYQR